MQKNSKYLPHLIAMLIFVVISAIYFAPQYAGKDIRKGDDIQYNGMKGGITEHVEKYDEHPQWAPNMFGGMPAYLIDMNYDGRYIKNLADKLYFMGKPAAFYFVLMAGFYFMLLCFGVNPLVALVGSVAYGLSTYFVIIYEAGHITKLMALAYIAPMIGAVFLTYRKNMILGASLTGIFAAIEISTSHPQITYYFFYVLLALAIFEGVSFYKQGRLKSFFTRSAMLLGVATLALGANIIQLRYIQDYTNDSIRGKSELTTESNNQENHTTGLDKDYITAWSYGKMETLNLLIPNLMGGSSTGGFKNDGEVAKSLKPYGASNIATSLPAYWGPQPFTSGAVYIGAVIIFLAVLGLFIVKGWIKWWLVSVSILAIFLAWGKNMMWFTDLFIDYVPLYNKFRTVSMILVIVQWSIPLLGMLALNKIYNREIEKSELIDALKRTIYIVGGILVAFLLLGNSLLSFTSDNDLAMRLPEDVIAAMSIERAELMRADVVRSLILVLLAAASIWGAIADKLRRNVAIVILLGLVTFDMVGVGTRFLNYDDFVPKKAAVEIQPTSANLEILKDNDPNFRVANLAVSTFNDAQTSYFHKSIGGYHAAKLRRYQDVIDRYLSKMDLNIYNMLNTKYFITPAESGALQVQLNPDAYGNAWFVEDVRFTDSADEEIAAIGEVDLLTTAVVDSSLKSIVGSVNKNGSDSTATIELIDSKANSITYRTNSENERVAIFSEIYYPKGWIAYIDGEESDYFRANYLLRAMIIPSGEHTIEFKFAAPNFGLMKGVTIASSLILLLMFIVSATLPIIIRSTNNQ